MKTCFPEENNMSKRNKIENVVYDMEKPFYTLIWYDCPKCRDLVFEFEKLHLKYVYINGNIYFNDIMKKTNEFNNPLLYKEEELIGDNLFDIYEEIYKASG